MLIPTEGKQPFTYELGIDILESLYSLPEPELSRDLHTVMGLMLQCVPLDAHDIWKFFAKFLDLHWKELSPLVRAMINLEDRFIPPMGLNYEEPPIRGLRGKKHTTSSFSIRPLKTRGTS